MKSRKKEVDKLSAFAKLVLIAGCVFGKIFSLVCITHSAVFLNHVCKYFRKYEYSAQFQHIDFFNFLDLVLGSVI